MASAYKIAYGQTIGQARAIQEHQLAMIPIMKEQAEMELSLREKQFAVEIEQVKQMNLLAQKLKPAPQLQPAPILIPAGDEVSEKPATNDYLIYAGLAALAFFLLR